MGDVPYTLLYNRDPPLPVQKLFWCIEPYKGHGTLRKRIKQSQITLSMAAKMLERMWTNQNRHYQCHKATQEFWVGDLVLLKKHNADKMDLRWEPNYQVVKLKSPWSVLVENQISSKTKCWNISDLKAQHPSEDWTLWLSPISTAMRFINHPHNLPDVDISTDHDTTPDIQKSPGAWVDTRYNQRKSTKAPMRSEL